jgi:hypothetical protein
VTAGAAVRSVSQLVLRTLAAGQGEHTDDIPAGSRSNGDSRRPPKRRLGEGELSLGRYGRLLGDGGLGHLTLSPREQYAKCRTASSADVSVRTRHPSDALGRATRDPHHAVT